MLQKEKVRAKAKARKVMTTTPMPHQPKVEVNPKERERGRVERDPTVKVREKDAAIHLREKAEEATVETTVLTQVRTTESATTSPKATARKEQIASTDMKVPRLLLPPSLKPR